MVFKTRTIFRVRAYFHTCLHAINYANYHHMSSRKKEGVIQHLQAKIGRPIIVMHCVAHRLELAVLDAVKTCSYLSRFEDTVKSIFKFYFYSRRREVNEIANILEEDTVYYSGIQATRWLASRHRAICSLEKHFPTTVMHLQHKAGFSDEQGQ